ncbi:MAG: sarcosine oxidase subunit delta [Thermoleophilaceae bacterium]|nr:sarcosine oxidase subunit delta [Thermoleophilaceae bacterium]
MPGRSSHLTSRRPVSTSLAVSVICSLGQICLRWPASRDRTVSYVLTCPNCGPREVTDFSFGGEVNPRPRATPSSRELGAYNYFRDNVAGVQREWWFHRSGCGEWFLAERDTRTNQVLLTELPGGAA